jgi:bacterioferritin B
MARGAPEVVNLNFLNVGQLRLPLTSRTQTHHISHRDVFAKCWDMPIINLSVSCSEAYIPIAIVGHRIHTLFVIANQEIINAINEQIGNEFGAMLQYYVIAAHFDAEGLPDLSAHFYERAEEEKKHALRIIQSVIDAGARVNIPTVFAPRAHFSVAEDAIKLSLEQEERVSTQVDALASMARAAHFTNDFKTSESDTTIANLLQWLVRKQSEEVARSSVTS